MSRAADAPSAEAMQATISRLVREALGAVARDQAAPDSPQPVGAARSHSAQSPGATSAKQESGEPRPVNEFAIAGSLITLASLEQLPTAIKHLRVAAGAVITPAARDSLRERGIQLMQGGPQGSAGVAGGKSRIPASTSPNQTSTDLPPTDLPRVIDPERPERARAVQHQLALRGIATKRDQVDSGAGPAGGSAVSLTGAGPVIWLSGLPARDVDRAGRGQGLVAVAIDSLEMVARVAAEMRPQIWVLDVSRLNLAAAVAVAERCLRTQCSDPPSKRSAVG